VTEVPPETIQAPADEHVEPPSSSIGQERIEKRPLCSLQDGPNITYRLFGAIWGTSRAVLNSSKLSKLLWCLRDCRRQAI